MHLVKVIGLVLNFTRLNLKFHTDSLGQFFDVLF
jgi:hypothetical protein